MRDYQPAKLLRLHFTQGDRYQGRPLYEAIVQKCLELKIAGATVFEGLEGFGETAEIHRSRVLAHDLPIVIQVIDSEENLRLLLPVVEEMMDQGLIAMSDVMIRRVEQNRLEPGAKPAGI